MECEDKRRQDYYNDGHMEENANEGRIERKISGWQ